MIIISPSVLSRWISFKCAIVCCNVTNPTFIYQIMRSDTLCTKLIRKWKSFTSNEMSNNNNQLKKKKRLYYSHYMRFYVIRIDKMSICHLHFLLYFGFYSFYLLKQHRHRGTYHLCFNECCSNINIATTTTT